MAAKPIIEHRVTTTSKYLKKEAKPEIEHGRY